jgi:glycosyltransferase involved in cell wall biosynthesis
MKIVYLAPIPFDFLKQRPQYIAEQLAKTEEVYYIEPTISLMKVLFKGEGTFLGRKYDASKNLHIFRANGLLTAHHSLDIFDPMRLNTVSERIQLRKIINNADIIWIGYSGWYPIVFYYKHKFLVYDKMDDNALMTQNNLLKKKLEKLESFLTRRANLIFVTALSFYDEISTINPNVYMLPNAVSRDIIRSDFPGASRDRMKKVFGYIGMIADWFDFEAIKTIIEASENHHVILVGPCNGSRYNHPRVTYTGRVSTEKLPQLLENFDVCLYPFQKSSFLDTIDPVKIYEYLAYGKPVLAIRSRETEKFGDLLYLYGSYDDLKQLCLKQLQGPFPSNAERLQFICRNCWETRAEFTLAILKKQLVNQ